jgi:hypothetical protein
VIEYKKNKRLSQDGYHELLLETRSLMKEESSCEQEMSADGGLLMGEWYLAPL